MRVVFLGSGPFAIPALECLVRLREKYPLVSVISRPDRPARRGRKLVPMPLKARAIELGVDCWTPDTVNDATTQEKLGGLKGDLFIVADYGELLRRPFLDLAPIGVFNLHGSLLPKYRGAAPVVHAMLAGEETSGVTLFRIEEGLDSGPIVGEVSTPIEYDETAGELEFRLAVLGAELLESKLDAFADGTFTEEEQDHSSATKAPKIQKNMGRIDWSETADVIYRRVQAFQPWPGSYSFLARGDGEAERLGILRVAPSAPGDENTPPGQVVAVTKKHIDVACGGGDTLRLLQIQRAGKPPMNTAAFLCGHAVQPGDHFRDSEEAEVSAART